MNDKEVLALTGVVPIHQNSSFVFVPSSVKIDFWKLFLNKYKHSRHFFSSMVVVVGVVAYLYKFVRFGGLWVSIQLLYNVQCVLDVA